MQINIKKMNYECRLFLCVSCIFQKKVVPLCDFLEE